MKNKRYLKAAVMQAEADRNKFLSDLQEIERHLVFHEFEDETPKVGINGNFEIFLNYNGEYMYPDEFIKRMEEVGYISKEDFIL